MWHFNTIDYYTLENDKFEEFVRKWMQLETQILNEINQSHKIKYPVSLIWESRTINKDQNKKKIIEKKERWIFWKCKEDWKTEKRNGWEKN